MQTDDSAPFAPFPRLETRRLRVALGTWIAFEIAGKEPLFAQQAIEFAFAAVRKVDALMHPHRAGSDLSVLNATAPDTPVIVDRETWTVLRLAQRISVASDGVFDPCLPSRPGRISDVELAVDQATVTCHAPVALDLGGIAKGYAVDRAVEELIAAGCDNGLVNAGGDLRVFGPGRRTILLRATDALCHVEFQPLELQDTALAASEFSSEKRPPEHQGYYVRGRTPTAPTAPLRQFAAVQASSAAVADALSKCALLCSEELADRVLQEFQATRIR